MKAIFLAAGYATRLYPLTKNKAKPLLEVGGKTIMDHLLEKISGLVDDIFVVTNHRFAKQFEEWLVKQTRVYAYRMKKQRYDIGTLESYRVVKERFR